MRRIYLDNIRWMTVILVMIYHVFYMFNAVGAAGGVGGFAEVQYQDALLYAVYPWFMVLLFLVAGMCARYALEKSTPGEYVRVRTRKLLVPSTLGLLAYQWIVGYYNVRAGGGLEAVPPVIRYPVFALSGTGPLWFVQILWLFSLLLAAVKKADKEDKLWKTGGRCGLPSILLMALALWGSSQIGNMPVITTYRFGIYFAAFLLGYAVFSHDKAQERLEKAQIPLLAAGVLMGIAYTGVHFGQNYADPAILQSLLCNVFAWLMVLAVLGYGKTHFTWQNQFTGYMQRAGYGFYVLHYTFVIIPCYYLKRTSLQGGVIYILALLIVFTGTFALYEIIRRIPGVRFAVLGMKGRGMSNDKG